MNFVQWNPLLDSSNAEPSDWVRIATEIELNYNFDAFVVLHGTGQLFSSLKTCVTLLKKSGATDTMAYSSSALSFLLEDLGKTVVFIRPRVCFYSCNNHER